MNKQVADWKKYLQNIYPDKGLLSSDKLKKKKTLSITQVKPI